MPMPCSPLITPPAATQTSRISRPAAITRGELVGVAAVEGDVRVQVAVAGVEHVRESQPVAVRDRAHLLEHLGQLRARHDGVVHVEVRARGVPWRRRRPCARARSARARRRRARARSRSRPLLERGGAHALDLPRHAPVAGRRARPAARRRRRRGSPPRRRWPRPPRSCGDRRSPARPARARCG